MFDIVLVDFPFFGNGRFICSLHVVFVHFCYAVFDFVSFLIKNLRLYCTLESLVEAPYKVFLRDSLRDFLGDTLRRLLRRISDKLSKNSLEHEPLRTAQPPI